MRPSLPLIVLALAAAPPPLAAQRPAAEHVALGDSVEPLLHPTEALVHYQDAIAVDSTGYEQLWKAARTITDVAKQIEGDADSLKRRRDSLYAVGRAWAEAAVRANPDGADGHYALALVVGRLSRTKGGKERVRFAKVIFDEATRAIALDSTHDGAHHVLGAWHAEVKRLSGIQRFFAKALFGGGFLGKANWEAAVAHLERAVALRPAYVYHRLELAEVYVDRGRYSSAREVLASIETLPPSDVMDPEYRQDAAALLDEIRDKKDKT